MITIESINGNIVRITPSETLKADDFAQLAPKAEALIRQHGKIRLLVDATKFNGWENMAAFEKHMGFVKSHHKSVERAAIIAGHAWQHWVAGVFRMFIHLEVRVFDKNEAAKAQRWISEEKKLSA